MRTLLFVAALGLVACPGGSIQTPGRDSGPSDSSPSDACTGSACDAGGSCDGMVCGEGQRCVAGVCVVEDICTDVVCANPGEVCDPRDGTCRPGTRDGDGDGYTIAGGDCHDGMPSIHPGAEEICDGIDQDCDREVDELPPGTCTTSCGSGEARCLEGAWVCSVPESCECTPLGLEESEPCGHCGTRTRTCTDWSWSDWSGCAGDGECDPGAAEDCTTGCHSAGTRLCDDRCSFGACQPPEESCNGQDDDCDGECDEGCRHEIYRCKRASNSEHYYTETVELCESGGGIHEPVGDIYLYTASAPGTTEFWHCFHSGANDHLYTTHPSCEDQAGFVRMENVGFIGTSSFCGAALLYRLRSASGHDHLYTVDSFEVSTAESIGYVREGNPGYVWRSD